MRYIRFVLLPVLVLSTLAFWGTPATAAPVPAPVGGDLFAYYPQTGHNVSFQVKEFYDSYGGPEIFGLPITEVISDTHTGLQVQYFERARFELHPENPPEHYIQLSLVGTMLTQSNAISTTNNTAFEWLAESPDPNRNFYPQSGHTLGGAFQYFWETNGGETIFGYPISEEFTEINPIDGQPYLVQYFQRAKFEYHPENQGGPGEVQLAHLGRQLLNLDPRAEQLRQPVRAIQLLGEATTSYAASIRERRHNIARATDLFNGTIVPPDTEFSFNSVSDFSTASGFVEGYAIIGGRLELVVAGGLCQVSTTMFRAVSNAGLKITHRQGHTFIVNFYENILGFDATVYDPDVDFRWYNDTPGPVYIAAQSNPEASTVTFWLWGYDDGRTVSYEGPYTSNWTQPGPAIWEYDPTMPAGAVRQLVHGRSGTDVVYIRTVTMPDGRVLHHDRFFTHYEPWADFYVYGPGGRN